MEREKRDQYIVKNYGVMDTSKIAEHLGYSNRQITIIAGSLRQRGRDVKLLEVKNRWTKEQDDFIRNNLDMKAEEMAERLNMKVIRVYSRRSKIRIEQGITKPKPSNERLNIESHEIYKRALTRKVGGILNLRDIRNINLDKRKTYNIQKLQGKADKKYANHFTGKIIQETDRNYTLKNKLGIVETFIKVDILTEEYLFEEAK